MIIKQKMDTKPVVIETTKSMKKDVDIFFYEDNEEQEQKQIITLNIYYEDRDGENWLDHFTVNEDVTQIEDRADVASEVLDHLHEEISQQSEIQSVCDTVDRIVDETIKRLKIQEVN